MHIQRNLLEQAIIALLIVKRAANGLGHDLPHVRLHGIGSNRRNSRVCHQCLVILQQMIQQ